MPRVGEHGDQVSAGSDLRSPIKGVAKDLALDMSFELNSSAVAREMLKLAGVNPKDFVYDLG